MAKHKSKAEKAQFAAELAALLPALPKSYGVIIANKYPGADTERLHQVKRGRIFDWQLLKMLQKEFGGAQQAVEVQPEKYDLSVYTVNGVSCVDSRAVAQGLGIEHRALLASVDKYKGLIEGEFGILTFDLLSSQGGESRRYHLNEGQANVLGTFAQNTPEAVAFKVKLISAFQRAKQFIKALTSEQAAPRPLLAHTKRAVQVANSRSINAVMFEQGGEEAVKQYNREHCQLVIGMKPHEVRALGKMRGLKSLQTRSAKEVARALRPDIACQMSLDDELASKGLPIAEAVELTRGTLPLFKKMIELGIAPAELSA